MFTKSSITLTNITNSNLYKIPCERINKSILCTSGLHCYPSAKPECIPFYQNFVPNHLINHIPNCVPNHVTSCVSNHVTSYVPSHVRNCIPNSVRNCISNPVRNYIPNPVRKCIPNCGPNRVKNCTPNCVSNCVSNCVPSIISDPNGNLFKNVGGKYGRLYSYRSRYETESQRVLSHLCPNRQQIYNIQPIENSYEWMLFGANKEKEQLHKVDECKIMDSQVSICENVCAMQSYNEIKLSPICGFQEIKSCSWMETPLNIMSTGCQDFTIPIPMVHVGCLKQNTLEPLVPNDKPLLKTPSTKTSHTKTDSLPPRRVKNKNKPVQPIKPIKSTQLSEKEEIRKAKCLISVKKLTTPNFDLICNGPENKIENFPRYRQNPYKTATKFNQFYRNGSTESCKLPKMGCVFTNNIQPNVSCCWSIKPCIPTFSKNACYLSSTNPFCGQQTPCSNTFDCYSQNPRFKNSCQIPQFQNSFQNKRFENSFLNQRYQADCGRFENKRIHNLCPSANKYR